MIKKWPWFYSSTWVQWGQWHSQTDYWEQTESHSLWSESRFRCSEPPSRHAEAMHRRSMNMSWGRVCFGLYVKLSN